MSGISRFIFRIRQSPNEFGSASFGRNRRFRTRFGASVSGCKDRFLPIKMQSCPEVLQKREIFVYLQTRSRESGSDGRVARQRSAKPCTAVRIRFRPHQNTVVVIYNGVLFLACHTSSDIRIIRVLIEAVAEMHSCINNYRNLIHSILILG